MIKLTLSLKQLFGLTIGGLAVLLGLIFSVLFQGSRTAILDSATRLCEAAAREMDERVAQNLEVAEGAVRDFEVEVRRGTVNPEDSPSIAQALFATLLRHPDLAEARLRTASSQETTQTVPRVSPDPAGGRSHWDGRGRDTPTRSRRDTCTWRTDASWLTSATALRVHVSSTPLSAA